MTCCGSAPTGNCATIFNVRWLITSTVLLRLFGTYTSAGSPRTTGLRSPGASALYTFMSLRWRPPLRPAFGAGDGLAAPAVSACGASGTTTSTTASRSPAAHARASHAAGAHPPLARLATFVYHPRYQLPAPLKDPAVAVLGAGRFALFGGLDSSEVSSAGIEIADASGVLHTGRLPLAQHDAQGAELGGEVYVFGGGSATELDHIISFDPARGAVSTVGALPRAQSDVAVAAAGGAAYVVGGYDGTNWLNTILARRPGSPVRVAGHLPVGLRYAAAAVGGRILIIGGSAPDGASSAVYRFDPATGRVREIGRLPQPITHASAALGAFVYQWAVAGTIWALRRAVAGTIWALRPRPCGQSIRAPAPSRWRDGFPSRCRTRPRCRSAAGSSSPAG